MKPVKRMAHKSSAVTNLLEVKRQKVVKNTQISKTQTVATQTEKIQPQTSQFSKSKTNLTQQKKGPASNLQANVANLYRPNSRNKACQTLEPSPETTAPMPMDSIMKTMLKRRKKAVDVHRERLKKLLEEINADPPPSWHTASLMWLDVDVLERRIEEFEKEEAESKEATKSDENKK